MGWDGTYKGKPVKEGVYFCLVKAKEQMARPIRLKEMSICSEDSLNPQAAINKRNLQAAIKKNPQAAIRKKKMIVLQVSLKF